MSFRPQHGLLRKFEFSLWGDRERALAGAKHFASLLKQYLKEFDSTKKKTRTEFLDKHGVKHRYYQSYYYVYGIYGSENIKSYIILGIFVLYHIKF